MSIEIILIANHLNKIQAGRKTTIELPTAINEMLPKKAAIALICIGYGLKKTCELCLDQSEVIDE